MEELTRDQINQLSYINFMYFLEKIPSTTTQKIIVKYANQILAHKTEYEKKNVKDPIHTIPETDALYGLGSIPQNQLIENNTLISKRQLAKLNEQIKNYYALFEQDHEGNKHYTSADSNQYIMQLLSEREESYKRRLHGISQLSKSLEAYIRVSGFVKDNPTNQNYLDNQKRMKANVDRDKEKLYHILGREIELLIQFLKSKYRLRIYVKQALRDVWPNLKPEIQEEYDSYKKMNHESEAVSFYSGIEQEIDRYHKNHERSLWKEQNLIKGTTLQGNKYARYLQSEKVIDQLMVSDLFYPMEEGSILRFLPILNQEKQVAIPTIPDIPFHQKKSVM